MRHSLLHYTTPGTSLTLRTSPSLTHTLPLTDESQKPLGVVTLLDIMKALMLVSHRSFHDWQKKVGAHPPPSAE